MVDTNRYVLLLRRFDPVIRDSDKKIKLRIRPCFLIPYQFYVKVQTPIKENPVVRTQYSHSRPCSYSRVRLQFFHQSIIRSSQCIDDLFSHLC